MKTLDAWKARGLTVLDPWKTQGLKRLKAPQRTYPVKPANRWTKDANGRTLPLNSDAWRKLRKQVLSEVPLCQYCPPGALTPATEVDHKNNDPADNSRDNLVSTCKPCHSIKTMADLHGREARMGCDAEGNPINPSHHWNAAAVAPSGALAGEASDQKSQGAKAPEPTTALHLNANRTNEP